jgi:hypothetical protein
MNPVVATTTLLLQKERAVRLLKRVAREVEDEETRPKRAKIIELCTQHTLRDCTCSHDMSLGVDDWSGGYIFLYWIIVAGPKWLRRITKEELEVSFVYF